MKNIDKIVKVTGIVERLDVFLLNGKIVFFVDLPLKNINLSEKSSPSRPVRLAPNQMMTLVCEIHNIEPTPDTVLRLMPGKQVSFDGVLVTECEHHIMIVSSIITDDGSAQA